MADAESATPENVRQLIEKQIERLTPDERTVLEGASVVGMDCSTVAIAAGLDVPIAWVEERCEPLARRHQFLLPARLAELPDGTLTPRYTFSHVLYLDVPYGLLPAMRRAQIHRRIGHAGEAIYGDRVGEIATELAMHFEQGRDAVRAVTYLLQAAGNAMHRSAHHESAALARRGLQAIAALPETPARTQQELSLRMILGASLMATKGFAAAEVEEVFGSARLLCPRQDASPQTFWIEWSLGLCCYFRASLQPALAIAEQLLDLPTTRRETSTLMEAHRACGAVLVELGRSTDAVAHLEQVVALYERDRHHAYAASTGHDPKVVSEFFVARALWALGYPDQALARSRRGMALADELSHTQSLVLAAHFAAGIHQLRGEASPCQERAALGLALADEYGLELWIALGDVHRGWAAVEQGQVDAGIQQMTRGLTAYGATGARLWRAYFLGLLADALRKAGRFEEGLNVAAEALALVHDTGEQFAAPELHRIQGELLIARATGAGGRPDDDEERAEGCFTQAVTIARGQEARSWELRAATSLGRLYHAQGRTADARRAVSEIYAWFTEGHETADLQAAKAVLAATGAPAS